MTVKPADAYLIWSHEHGRWWGPDGCGYERSLRKAGRYSRDEALAICIRAIPGDAHRLGALPELPVCEADLLVMREKFRSRFPDLPQEPWE